MWPFAAEEGTIAACFLLDLARSSRLRPEPMTTVTATKKPLSTKATAPANLEFGSAKIHRNLSVPLLIETAIKRGEGILAANGALMCDTGERTGRSPNDKFLEDTPGIHDSIGWGKTNQGISPENFAK